MKVKVVTMVCTALLGAVLMTGCAGRTELFVEKTVTNTDGSTQHIKATGSANSKDWKDLYFNWSEDGVTLKGGQAVTVQTDWVDMIEQLTPLILCIQDPLCKGIVEN